MITETEQQVADMTVQLSAACKKMGILEDKLDRILEIIGHIRVTDRPPVLVGALLDIEDLIGKAC